MVDVILRAEKGTPLTHEELDANFTVLQDAVNESAVFVSPTPPPDPYVGMLWLS